MHTRKRECFHSPNEVTSSWLKSNNEINSGIGYPMMKLLVEFVEVTKKIKNIDISYIYINQNLNSFDTPPPSETLCRYHEIARIHTAIIPIFEG